MGLLSFLRPKPDGLHLGIGYSLDDYRKERLIDLYQLNNNRKSHTFVAGATRVGKTRLLQNMIVQDIRAGRSVGLIDPKGDWEIWEAMVQEAYKTGRERELLFISPIYPEYSVSINPLTNFMIEEEPINHIVAGVPSDDEFFYNVALETTTVIVKTLLLQKRREDTPTGELNIDEVCELASYSGIMKCKEIVKPLLGADKDAERIQALIDQVLGSGFEYFSKVSTTLRTALTQMTVGQTGRIMGSVRGNRLIERLENQERVICYAQTGSMLTNEVSKIMSRVLVSMLQSLSGRLFARGKTLNTPLCLYMDEFSNMVYRGIENFFNKGGAANCYLTAATQSLADVEAAVGSERARMIFDNTNTKIFMRVNDLKTAQTLAAYGGVKRVYSYILGHNGAITTRESEDDVIKPAEFLNLQPREFFYFGFEGRYFGKSDPIESVELRIGVDQIELEGDRFEEDRSGEGSGLSWKDRSDGSNPIFASGAVA
jgi:type IV secretory pathway TraG/TraD family ATPase VirD4